jgi:hypothetical protein
VIQGRIGIIEKSGSRIEVAMGQIQRAADALARCPEKKNSLTGPIENSPQIFQFFPPVRLPFWFFSPVRHLRTPVPLAPLVPEPKDGNSTGEIHRIFRRVLIHNSLE